MPRDQTESEGIIMGVTINGIPLPEQAIDFEYRRLVQFYSSHLSAEQLKEQQEALRKRAVEQAIGAKLLIDEAHRLDLPVPADMIDRELAKLAHQAGGEEALHAQLAQQGISAEQLQQSIRESCKVNVLVEQICKDVQEPTEAEMEAHFKAHADEYQRGERAAAQHILLRPASDSEADHEVARSRLEEMRAQLVDGADFADLATMQSDCPSGKQTGGSLGWFGRGMMVPEFDAAVFDMEVGDLSELIKTQFGYHLVYKTGHDEGGPAEFTDVSDKVRDFLRHVRRGEAVSAYVRELREKATVAYTSG